MGLNCGWCDEEEDPELELGLMFCEYCDLEICTDCTDKCFNCGGSFCPEHIASYDHDCDEWDEE